MRAVYVWIAAIALATGCEKSRTEPAATPPPEPPPSAIVPADASTPPVAPPETSPPAAGADARVEAAPPPKGEPAKADVVQKLPTDRQPPVRADGKPAGGKGRCGGIAAFACGAGEKCRYGVKAYKPPYPDAMGECVPETFCDVPANCEGLIHPMVVGKWACERSNCAWKAEGGAPQ